MIAASYANLPTEILIKIFLYLGFSDILAARLCCKTWFNVTSCSEFASKISFEIRGNKELSSIHPAAQVLSASKIENLCLGDIEFGDVDEFFEQSGPNIKRLTLESVLSRPPLELTLTHFTNLQTLKVCDHEPDTYIENPPLCNLSQLKDLELINNDSNFDKYLLNCSMYGGFLEKLTFCVDQYLQDEALKILNKNAETLKILDLNFDFEIGTPKIGQWQRIATKLNLNELSLRNYEFISHDFMNEMVKNQKSLRSLCLEEINEISVDDKCLTLIVQNLPHLERLILFNCNGVKDIGIDQLARLPKLTALTLKNCCRITPYGIRSIIGQELNMTMTELHLIDLPQLDEETVSFCAQNLPSLKIFELNECTEAVTCRSVSDIFKYLRNLRDLRLNNCSYLRGFKRPVNWSTGNLKQLERLSLRGCKRLSAWAMRALRAPQLKFLNITGCLQMTGSGISILIKNCPGIEEIVFTSTEKMNEIVIDILINGLDRLRTLIIEEYEGPLEITEWKGTWIGSIYKLRRCM